MQKGAIGLGVRDGLAVDILWGCHVSPSTSTIWPRPCSIRNSFCNRSRQNSIEDTLGSRSMRHLAPYLMVGIALAIVGSIVGNLIPLP